MTLKGLHRWWTKSGIVTGAPLEPEKVDSRAEWGLEVPLSPKKAIIRAKCGPISGTLSTGERGRTSGTVKTQVGCVNKVPSLMDIHIKHTIRIPSMALGNSFERKCGGCAEIAPITLPLKALTIEL